MMPMGDAPWSTYYRAVHDKKQAEKAGYEWALSSGWRHKTPSTWTSAPAEPKMHRVHLATGGYTNVPEGDYNDYIGHTALSDDAIDNEKVAKYIDEAFSQADGETKKGLYDVEGCGHIARLVYSSYRQLLQVTFATKADTVVFFKVPSAVFGELYWLAQSKDTQVDAKGHTRHLLGIRFWDLIRIRGSNSAAKYAFKYTDIGSYESHGVVGRPTGSGKYDWVSVEKKDHSGETIVPVEKNKLNNTATGMTDTYKGEDLEDATFYVDPSNKHEVVNAGDMYDFADAKLTTFPQSIKDSFENAGDAAAQYNWLVQHGLINKYGQVT